MFKTIDEKFAEIGFIKSKEDMYGVTYERNVADYNFIQRLDLLHKRSGKHLIQSYDIHLTDEKKIGNTCVGLTMYEAKLCIKKMKKMGWKIKDGKTKAAQSGKIAQQMRDRPQDKKCGGIDNETLA